MNIFLWVLQAILTIHTLMGALWKFSHSAEETMPSLKAISHGMWINLGSAEIFLSLCLILPAFYKPIAFLVPVAALCISAEMLLFVVVHLASGDPSYSPVIYWLVVGTLCEFIAYGRFKLKAFKR